MNLLELIQFWTLKKRKVFFQIKVKLTHFDWLIIFQLAILFSILPIKIFEIFIGHISCATVDLVLIKVEELVVVFGLFCFLCGHWRFLKQFCTFVISVGTIKIVKNGTLYFLATIIPVQSTWDLATVLYIKVLTAIFGTGAKS